MEILKIESDTVSQPSKSKPLAHNIDRVTVTVSPETLEMIAEHELYTYTGKLVITAVALSVWSLTATLVAWALKPKAI